MLLSEDLCNRSSGFCALVIREEIPYPLSIGCPTDGLPEITRKHYVVVAPGYILILLLPATGGPALPGGPFRIGVSYQSPVEAPLPEVPPVHYSVPDLSGLADAQRLCKNNVVKDKGSLGVPTPAKNPLPFRWQDCHEAAPYYSRGRGIPSC